MEILQLDEFLRSIKQNIDTPHSLLLGAGASIESGIPSATDCIWDWKREIYLSKNPGSIGNFDNSKSEAVRRVIQRWIDAQNIYPAENSVEEYSYFAEKAYPIADDRRKYFQHLVANHDPSLGYHLISLLALENIIKSVWTTNFDGLTLKCAHQYSPLVPVEITAATSERIYRGDVDKELLCIALHGDYKYGALKNTEQELDSQDGELVKALLHELTNRDLIVVGYSGRDQSLMDALTQVYSKKGAGKLFWCGYGSNVPSEVETLIRTANQYGRAAFYIPTEGFDSTFYAIARHCMSENKEFLEKVDNIKKKLSITLEPRHSGFIQLNGAVNKVVSTNAFPVAFPNQCYQFEVLLASDEKPWDFCKALGKEDVMAVPYKNLVYAWGSKSVIEEVCKGKLKTNIELCPLSRASIAGNSTFRELLLKTLVHILAVSHGLGHSKDKIWDTKEVLKYRIGARTVTAYSGVKLALLFDYKYSYLTLVPSYMYADDVTLTSEERKQFADWFNARVNNGRPNLNANEYVVKWSKKIIGNTKFSVNYPVRNTVRFSFAVVNYSALIGVSSGKRNSIQLPAAVPKRIVFSGTEYKDPTLRFCSASTHGIAEDFHPMRGLISNAPVDYAMDGGILHSAISVGVICPDKHERRFAQFISELNYRSQAKHNTDYLITFPGFYQAFKTGLDLPEPNSGKWKQIKASNEQDIHKAAVEFGDAIIRKIDQLSADSVDVILIYIPRDYEIFTSYTDGTVKYDLHDYIKAYAAQKQVATQFVREKTIESDLHCQIMWALSLALYVKSGRIPWVINGIQADTAFAGIGYSVMNAPTGSNVVVGCSHIYSSDGRGMKYKLSKIHDYSFDRKKNPYLSEEEAYRIGLNIKELFYKSFSELPKRVVVHKRTPFRKDEVKGLVESLSSAGVKNIELLEIIYEDNLKCFALNESCTRVDGYPVRRGMCFPIDNNTMYLFTHGIAPSVISPNRKYFQGGKSVPLPLKVVKHYGSGDMAQIATEILGLSKMNWNSFGLYSKLPCTIESSNEIARIGWLLSQFEGTLYDYRYFM
ncbi:MAG: SIR2 family protein [Oscillospiraceae bacterium]|nr:SIR2 family protein [Oscillospiraceae bacterium]